MMNYKKHLRLRITNKLIFLFSVLVLTSCSKEPKKENFIARVNDSYLTREEFASLVDTTKLSKAEREQVIKSWIYRELLYQKAKDENIVDRNEYKNVLETSTKELAAALLLNDYMASEEIKISDAELIDYYQKNKNYFQLNNDSYLINKVVFNNEDKAVLFRSLAVESDWTKAANFFNSDSSQILNINSSLIEENSLYPFQLQKTAKDLYPQEISIVISENDNYYTIVQMLEKFSKGDIPDFEIVKDEVKRRFLAEKKKQLTDEYLKTLYSNNDIEIRK